MGIGWIGAAITIPFFGPGLPAILVSWIAADYIDYLVDPEHYINEARESWEREKREWEEAERLEAERRRLSGEANMKPNLGAVLRQNHEIYWRAQNDQWRRYVDSHRRPV